MEHRCCWSPCAQTAYNGGGEASYFHHQPCIYNVVASRKGGCNLCVAIFQPNFAKWPQTIVAWIPLAQYGIRNSDAADWQKQNVINFVLKHNSMQLLPNSPFG